MRSQILPIKRMKAEMDPARKMLSSIFVRSSVSILATPGITPAQSRQTKTQILKCGLLYQVPVSFPRIAPIKYAQ